MTVRVSTPSAGMPAATSPKSGPSTPAPGSASARPARNTTPGSGSTRRGRCRRPAPPSPTPPQKRSHPTTLLPTVRCSTGSASRRNDCSRSPAAAPTRECSSYRRRSPRPRAAAVHGRVVGGDPVREAQAALRGRNPFGGGEQILDPTGTPQSGRSSPALTPSASASARSPHTVTNAFRVGFKRSIASSDASTSSRARTSPSRTIAACSLALRCKSSTSMSPRPTETTAATSPAVRCQDGHPAVSVPRPGRSEGHPAGDQI